MHTSPSGNDSDPNSFISILPVAYAAVLSATAGAVSYLQKVDRKGIPFRLFSLVVEMSTSALAGIIAFMLCDGAGWHWQATAAVVAISGHMGARALALLERLAVSHFEKEIGYENFSREAGRQAEEKSHSTEV